MNRNREFEQLKIDWNESMLQAIRKMDRLKRKLLIVTRKDEFYSLISIGDIQRAIIKNIPFSEPIKNILRENVRVASEDEAFEAIKEKMLKFRTEFMPVVNKKNQIIKVYFWDDIIGEETLKGEVLNLPVVIMAGGKGTRLKPITNIIPKALVPIGEKPIIQLIIESFVKIGCTDFYISLNHKAEMIKQYFSEIENKDFSYYFFQEEKPLGTAGSLFLLKEKIDKTFFVSNCDILIDQDYREIFKYHKQNKNELTIVAALRHYDIPYGILETGEGGILKQLTEKPNLTFQVNTGLYVLEPHLLNEIPEYKFFHITDLIQKIQDRQGKVGVFPISEKSWIDIGKWQDYQQLFNKIR
ncbi:nucleotidyltransferase family protein [Calditrichota bacterium GD2]